MKELNQNELRSITGGGPRGFVYGAIVGAGVAVATASGIGPVTLLVVFAASTLLVSSER